MDDFILEYRFEFSFRTYEEKSNQLDLSFIDQKLNLKPTRTRFINLTSKPYRSNTAWIRESRVRIDTDTMSEDFERLILVFQRKEKEILEILQYYKQYKMELHFVFIPKFTCMCEETMTLGIELEPEVLAFMGRVGAKFSMEPYLSTESYLP